MTAGNEEADIPALMGACILPKQMYAMPRRDSVALSLSIVYI